MASTSSTLLCLLVLSIGVLTGACGCIGCFDTRTVSDKYQVHMNSPCAGGGKAVVNDLRVQSTDGASTFKVYTKLNPASSKIYTDASTDTSSTCFNKASAYVGGEGTDIYVIIECTNFLQSCPIEYDITLACVGGDTPTQAPANPGRDTPTQAPANPGMCYEMQTASDGYTKCVSDAGTDMTTMCGCYGGLLGALGDCPASITDSLVETCKTTVDAFKQAGANCDVAMCVPGYGGSGGGGSGGVTNAPALLLPNPYPRTPTPAACEARNEFNCRCSHNSGCSWCESSYSSGCYEDIANRGICSTTGVCLGENPQQYIPSGSTCSVEKCLSFSACKECVSKTCSSGEVQDFDYSTNPFKVEFTCKGKMSPASLLRPSGWVAVTIGVVVTVVSIVGVRLV